MNKQGSSHRTGDAVTLAVRLADVYVIRAKARSV